MEFRKQNEMRRKKKKGKHTGIKMIKIKTEQHKRKYDDNKKAHFKFCQSIQLMTHAQHT